LPPVDRIPVPVDTEPEASRRKRKTVLDAHPAFGDVVELRNEFDPAGVRHAGTQAHVQFHQEMRADGNVERFGKMRHLEPRRNAADAGDVGLHDRARAAREIFAEVRRVIQRLAHCDRYPGRARELDVTFDVFGRQRLFEPREAERREGGGPAACFVARESLIGIGHQLEGAAHRVTYRRQPRHVFAHVRSPDLDLCTAESGRLRGLGLLHELRRIQMQPAALGRVNGHARLRTPEQLP
jgi:hypothetical protein